MRSVCSRFLAAGMAVMAAQMVWSGCATPKRGGAPEIPEVAASPSPSGIPQSGAPTEIIGPPEPTPSAEAKDQGVVLVLGPGLARSFAHAGVIRALVDAKIRVKAVVGTEIGAIVAALYAWDGAINRLEWRMMKLKNEHFSERPLFSRGPSEARRLEDAMGSIFRAAELRKSSIPIWVGVGSEKGSAVLLNDGSARETLRLGLGFPGVYSSGKRQGNQVAQSSVVSKTYLVREARALGLEAPVIAIDLMSGPTALPAPATSDDSREQGARDLLQEFREAAAEDLREADLVIRPDLGDLAFLDFKKRTEAIFRGRKAVEARMEEIRAVAGRGVQK